VYDRKAEKIGTVADIMLDKRSGKVVYAVLTVGTFLGLGGKHYPLPWSMLRYDTRLGGYVVNLDRERLENAPSYADNDNMDYAARGSQVHDYWEVPPYWAR